MGVVRVDLKAYADSVSEFSSDNSALEDGLQSTVRLRFVVFTNSIHAAYDDWIVNASGPNEQGQFTKILPTGTKGLEPNVPVGDSVDYPRWILTGKEVTKLGNMYYQVDCTWSRIPGAKTDPTYQVNGIRIEEPAYYDIENKPILNSAGQIFDPPLVKTYYDQEILVSFTMQKIDAPLLESFRGKVNENSVTLKGIEMTYPARSLMVAEIQYSNTWQANYGQAGVTNDSWRIDVRFQARRDKFITKVLNQGWNTKNPTTDELTTIVDRHGERLQQQSMLDTNGQKLEDGADPVFLDFKLEPEADFTNLLKLFQT